METIYVKAPAQNGEVILQFQDGKEVILLVNCFDDYNPDEDKDEKGVSLEILLPTDQPIFCYAKDGKAAAPLHPDISQLSHHRVAQQIVTYLH